MEETKIPPGAVRSDVDEKEARRRAEEEAQFRSAAEILRRAAQELARKEAHPTATCRKVERETRGYREEEQRRLAEFEVIRKKAQEEARKVEVEVRRATEDEGRVAKLEAVRRKIEQESVVSAAGVVCADKGIAPVNNESSFATLTTLDRLNSEDAGERARGLAELAPVGGEDSFHLVTKAFEDSSAPVRNAAARALHGLQANSAASFTRALREATPEGRRRIAGAIGGSGLAADAINNLTSKSRDRSYDAFSLLFLMAKAGEVQPLMQAIEEHSNPEVRLAVVKLLILSGQAEIVPALRRFAVRDSLPAEVRTAVVEAIYQMSRDAPKPHSQGRKE